MIQYSKIPNLLQRTITFIILLCCFLFIFFWLPPVVLSVIFALCCVYILIAEWPQLCKSSYFLSALTPLYPIIPFILLILLNQDLPHRLALFIMFALVCAFDTGAYIAGSLFGTHKIAPRISPGKTWEGIHGGLLFCTVSSIFFVLAYKKCYLLSHLIPTLIITYATSILAFSGDLFESWLKRRVGVKDSGTLLPGHGGLLDRFDSILFAIFFFYAFRSFIMLIIT